MPWRGGICRVGRANEPCPSGYLRVTKGRRRTEWGAKTWVKGVAWSPDRRLLWQAPVCTVPEEGNIKICLNLPPPLRTMIAPVHKKYKYFFKFFVVFFRIYLKVQAIIVKFPLILEE